MITKPVAEPVSWKGKMIPMIRAFFLILFLIGSRTCFSQGDIPIGTWRTHLSYRAGIGVANTGDRIYCLTDRGLFFFDVEEKTLNRVTKVDGLSAVESGTIGYAPEQNVLLITYRDGTIDQIQDNVITPFTVLRDSELMGDKGVTHISFGGNFAFLSSELGMIVMDLTRQEIKEAYTNLGPEGLPLAVNASAILTDSLFLATESGMIAASLSDEVNRLDFRNWKRFQFPGANPTPLSTSIVSFDGRIFVWTGSGLFSYSAGVLTPVEIPVDESVNHMQVSGDQLVITLQTQLALMSPQLVFDVITDPEIAQPKMALIDGPGTTWIADYSKGLVSNLSGSYSNSFPGGPFSNQVFHLSSIDNGIVAVPGGYDANKFPFQNKEGFFVFQDGGWSNYNPTGDPGSTSIPEIADLVDMTGRPESGIFASFGWGLLQWQGDNFTIIDENTPDSPLMNANPPGRNTQITSVELEASGDLWVTNHGVATSVHRLSAGGQWRSYSFASNQSRFPLDILPVGFNDLWVRLSPEFGGGILVFDSETEQNRTLTSADGNGGLPSSRVNDYDLDQEGQVWVGTDNGVAFFPNPIFALDQNQFDATLPVFESQFLLRGQRVTAMKTDGGNRKWMGTENGVWLFEPSGEEVVFHFTAENSPLLSNRIIDIEIDPRSGEVFFATDLGISSFRGTAAEGSEVHQNVKIFPNPVRPDFDGIVGISGLASGAVVKITDSSGKLVREILAEGGTATWDVLDLSGRKVASGVYIIFSSTRDGSDTFIGKIAVVN